MFKKITLNHSSKKNCEKEVKLIEHNILGIVLSPVDNNYSLFFQYTRPFILPEGYLKPVFIIAPLRLITNIN